MFQSPIILSKQTRKQCEVRHKHNIKQIVHISKTMTSLASDMNSVAKHDIKLINNFIFNHKKDEEEEDEY